MGGWYETHYHVVHITFNSKWPQYDIGPMNTDGESSNLAKQSES